MSLIDTFRNILILDGQHTIHLRGNMPDNSPSSWNGSMNGQSKLRALSDQVGGSHYKDMAIQPFEFIEANNLGFAVGNIVKYLCRYKRKGGIEDLKKARHYIDMLIEREGGS